MKRYSYNNLGFSLIEIMVAILILGTVFVGLVQAFPFALRIIKSAEDQTKASFLAQEKMEELIRTGYADIATGTIEVKAVLTGADYRRAFSRQTDVEWLDPDLNPSATEQGFKKITITVYYMESFTKQEKTYVLRTLLSTREKL